MSDDFLTRRKAQLDKEKAEGKSKIKPVLLPTREVKEKKQKKLASPKGQEIITIIEKAKVAGEELEKLRVQRLEDLNYSYPPTVDQILPPPQPKKEQ
jgi:hypothetical protein